MGERYLALRAGLWPEITDDDLWLRLQRKGFTTIPRMMTLFMVVMDDMSKGKPVSLVYLELWCRAYDEGFVKLQHTEMAYHSGFTGQRGVRTWRERIHILWTLGFIDLKGGPSGPESFALILNPYKVLQNHRAKKTPGSMDDKFTAILARAIEIGAKDLDPQNIAAA